MSGSQADLDLSTVGDNEDEKILNMINSYYMSDSQVKTQLAWHWERIHLMLDGKQWLVFDSSREGGGLWNKLRVSKQNEYIPRPVTNYMFSCYQTLKSYLIKEKPRSSVRPNTNEYEDVSAAKIGTLVLEANWKRLKEQENYETAAAALLTYGTVFKKSYWDTSSKRLVKVPKMHEVPMTDPMTGMPMGMAEEPMSDPVTGDIIFEELPLGDVNTKVIDPFCIAMDPIASNIHEARWIMEYSIQSVDWIKETYMKDAPGYTGKADQVKAEKNLNGIMRRWYNLRTSSGIKSQGPMFGAGAAPSETMIDNAAVVKEYYECPDSEYPKGRLIVVAGDQLVYIGDSPYEGPELGDWHPYSECRWEIVPGRFWGKSPFDDAAEIQKQINSIDSIVTLTRKTMAIPQWLIPNQSGITPGSMTGRPGQQHFFRPDPSGAAPTPIRGMGVDASVFQERAQHVEDMKEITGAIDILKGGTPPGATAASAISLLYEVGTGKLSPIIDRWKEYVSNDQKKQLKIVQKYFKEPRPEFIRLLRSLNEDLDEQSINQFIGRDLNDNCNVIVEAGSNIPKLQAAKQQLLMELAKMGMLNLQDPGNRVQFQQDLGITGYDADVEPDRKRAQWENSLLDSIHQTPDKKPVVFVDDNHDLHIAIHTNRTKSPNFMALPADVQQAYMHHIQEHQQQKAQAQQAQMLQQQAMAPQPGAGAAPQNMRGGGGGAPAPHAPHHGHTGSHPTPGKGGRGMTREAQNAILGTDLNPGALMGAKG